MARNFYYGKDAAIVRGSANFAALISASAESFGLTSEQSSAYAALDALLQSAYLASITPDTRTPVAVAQKNLALRNVQKYAVCLARIAYATSTVSDAQLMSLGLQPRPVPAARALASAPPTVTVISVIGRVVKVRIADPSSPERRTKPIAALGANLFSFVGPEAPSDPRQYHYEGMATRATAEIVFPNHVESGATVWLSACWVSTRGASRPVGGRSSVGSVPISLTLQGGPVTASAAA